MIGHFKFGLKKTIKYVVLKAIRPYLGIFAESLFCINIANFIVFNQIGGDYLEFGVWEGDWFAEFYSNIINEQRNYLEHATFFGHQTEGFMPEKIRFFAFDSFEGLPSIEAPNTPQHFAAGVYSSSKQFFIENIAHRGVQLDRIGIIEGWYSDTLNKKTKQKLGLEKAAAIFIDCDLYESSIPVFQFISDLIHNGTVLIIDDWFRYQGHPQKGIQRAFNEWTKKNPQYLFTELSRCSANRIAFICSDQKKPSHMK